MGDPYVLAIVGIVVVPAVILCVSIIITVLKLKVDFVAARSKRHVLKLNSIAPVMGLLTCIVVFCVAGVMFWHEKASFDEKFAKFAWQVWPAPAYCAVSLCFIPIVRPSGYIIAHTVLASSYGLGVLWVYGSKHVRDVMLPGTFGT
jgi:hypothetical protein